MTREPSPAPRFAARILALLSDSERPAANDDLASTRLARYRDSLSPHRDYRTDHDTARREWLPLDEFRGFRDPASLSP